MLSIFLLSILLQNHFFVVQSQWLMTYEAFQSDQITDLDGWVVQNQYQATFDIITKCGSKSILGGLRSFGSKAVITKMIKIPPHFKLKFIIQLWKIGIWENEKIQIFIDGIPWEMKWGFTEGGKQLCGSQNSQNGDKIYDVEFELAHNSPTATLVITSTQQKQADLQAWGIRNIKISFKQCPSECGICKNEQVKECKFLKQIDLSWFRTDTAVEGWTLREGKGKSYQCSGIVLFGGPNNIGTKSVLSKLIQNIPPHSKILIKFTLWKFGIWDNEQFTVNMDGENVYSITYQKYDGINICGNKNSNEKLINVEINHKHNQNQLLISFQSTLREDSEYQSWGIRDFFAFSVLCPKFCLSCIGQGEQDCLQCQSTHELKEGKCINKNKWYIFNKEFTNENNFNIDQWNIQTYDFDIKNYISKCGNNIQIFGGYNIFGKKAIVQKIYTKLPSHDFIRIRLTIYKIDKWDGEELVIYGDDNRIWGQLFGWNDPGQSNLCGNPQNPWKDTIMFIDQIISHNSDTFTLQLSSNLQVTADIASWGFRDLLILYSPINECILLYSECNYQGNEYKLCENNADLSNLNFEIKSMIIPQGMTFIGYKKSQFKGDRIEYQTNQQCLKDIEFSFLQKL